MAATCTIRRLIVPHRAVLSSLRHASTAAAQPCPWAVLGLPPGSEKPKIKARFYELAKQTHPDVAPAATAEDAEDAAEASPKFVEILAAFESLMDGSAGGGGGSAGSSSGPASNRSSRDFTGGFGFRRGAQGVRVNREPTLGEVLCVRLREEPGATLEVWADVKARALDVNEWMMEELFRACGSVEGTKHGLGLDAALDILRDSKRLGLLTPHRQQAACISLIKWCKEDSTSFARIMREFEGEGDGDLEGRDTLAYANALYSGVSDGYGASKT
jgi:hypothetical protein|eukprot:Transcript_28916.p1 GENE.Transcript_28916~~Transcript_28916.p1  ORF type:complete len:309 (+),score=85.27 Transcript_28916:109-927(+)